MTIPWGIGWGESFYTVKSPSVISSAFQAPDGNLGIILYNLEDNTRRISIKLDDREYQASDKNFTVVYPAELEFEKRENVLSLIIPAQCPVIIEGRRESI